MLCFIGLICFTVKAIAPLDAGAGLIANNVNAHFTHAIV